jgi:hypothetical protein
MVFLLALKEIEWNAVHNEEYHDGSFVWIMHSCGQIARVWKLTKCIDMLHSHWVSSWEGKLWRSRLNWLRIRPNCELLACCGIRQFFGEYCFLGCEAAYSGRKVLTFRKKGCCFYRLRFHIFDLEKLKNCWLLKEDLTSYSYVSQKLIQLSDNLTIQKFSERIC